MSDRQTKIDLYPKNKQLSPPTNKKDIDKYARREWSSVVAIVEKDNPECPRWPYDVMHGFVPVGEITLFIYLAMHALIELNFCDGYIYDYHDLMTFFANETFRDSVLSRCEDRSFWDAFHDPRHVWSKAMRDDRADEVVVYIQKILTILAR